MSHAAKITTDDFKVMESLKKAFQDLGWTIKLNSEVRIWAGHTAREGKKYSVVAVAPDPENYDIGLESDGKTISMDADFSMMSARSLGDTRKGELGQRFPKLTQRYNVRELERITRQKMRGRVARTRELENGDVEMELEVPA